MGEAKLVAECVTKSYFRKARESARNFDAVHGASISLAQGELTGLVGRSGGGKSTLLAMLAGLLVPSSGTVSFDGQDLYALSDARLSRLRNDRFGVVPQGQTPIFDLTVLQNVTLPYSMFRDGSADARALELLDRMGIKELADSYPAELSGGEMRRMAIARALINNPAVLFADEPTGDLDDENTAKVLALLREVADQGAAVLLVTHEQSAARFADRIMRMDGGRLT